MKKTLFTISLLIIGLSVKAQYNYSEWGLGVSYGTVTPFSDLAQNDTQKGGSASLYWNYSPYMPFAFEVQTGKLSGGNDVTDVSHRYFVNNYLGFNAHGDLQMGEIIDYEGNIFLNALKGFYIGLGVGVMFDNITSVRRVAQNDPTYIYPGSDHSITALIPIRLGYEIKILNSDAEPVAGIDFGYTHNLTFAEGLDGYADPSNKFKNNSQDMFRSLTVGVKFYFGRSLSYIKSIR